MTYHAKDGLRCRLAGAGIDPMTLTRLETDAYHWAKLSPGPEVHAIRLAVLPHTLHSGSSVGDTVWVICKNSVPLTVYLRHQKQGPPPCDKYTYAA